MALCQLPSLMMTPTQPARSARSLAARLVGTGMTGSPVGAPGPHCSGTTGSGPPSPRGSGPGGQAIGVAETDRPRGWHPDPEMGPGHFRYWDGHRWTGTRKDAPGSQVIGLRFHGWRRIWYLKLVKFSLIAYPLAWVDSMSRHRLGPLMTPKEIREAREQHGPKR
jgi:hypothetical protein